MERALIVHGVWLDLILDGKKPWEMRSTKTSVRGTVGLIQSGTGLIMGKVDLVDCLGSIGLSEYSKYIEYHRIPKGLPGIREKYKYPWVFENPVRFTQPVSYNHPKGAVIWVKLSGDHICEELT